MARSEVFSRRLLVWLCLCLKLTDVHSANSAYSQGVSDVTNDVGLNGIDGIIASFGDFDSDRDTDLFVITNKGKRVEVFLWEGSSLKFSKAAAFIEVKKEEVITNVSPADFDGDGCMDLLVVTRNTDGKSPPKTTIYWSDSRRLQKGYETEMEDEPLILDINGDLLPDLFGTDTSGERKYWISMSGVAGQKRKFMEQNQNNATLTSIRVPNTNAFVDVTGDFHADLFVVAQSKTNSILFEIWESTKGTLQYNPTLTVGLPPELKSFTTKSIGQISFGDFDADGKIDVLVPVCMSEDCSSSAFYTFSHRKWSLMLSNEQNWWHFPRPRHSIQTVAYSQIVARVGDITMDGYPDAVCIFEDSRGEKVVVILENVPCSSSSINCNGARTFKVRRDIPILRGLKNPAVVTLFDLYENGALDFFVVEQKDLAFTMKAVKNDFSSDTSFLKTAVLSGRCYKDCACRSSHTPYGANEAGAMVRYKTTTTDGKVLVGIGVQLCQSAYFSLQLPYIVFGLGRTPNFVDEIEVGIPQGRRSINRVHQWQSLIPNSQVIILPFPPDSPAEWQTKLLVTPSKILLQVGGVLLGLCLLVAGLILILHIKEKREDEKEKRQEAHKFHFDAL